MSKKSFALIGLGRFGMEIVKTLTQLKCELIAIDVDEARVTKASEYVNHCVICDSTKMINLKELGIGTVDHAVVAIGNNLTATILTTINLKELGVKRVTVRVDEEEYVTVMERIGADEVIFPEEASAISLANQIISDNVLDYYRIDKDYGVVQIKVNPSFIEKSLIELRARELFDINIVGITRNGRFFLPKGTDTVKPDDTIMIIGKQENVVNFEQFIS